MEDINYYAKLEVLERIKECSTNFSKLSKALGCKAPNVYNRYEYIITPKVKKLKDFAKALDVSYEYLLTGKNKEPYKEIEIDFNKMIKEYYSLEYGSKHNKNIAVIMHNLKKNETQDINIKTLFDISDMLKSNPYKLIVKEY